LASASVNYSHNSDNRNNIWNACFLFKRVWLYINWIRRWVYKLFNEKNTEISVKANAFRSMETYLPYWITRICTVDQFSEYRILFRRSCIRSKWC
jgi:hypothetical protein